MKEVLRQSAKNFPRHPGVYIFRDTRGRPLYIGKAKDLKKRVMSYFTGRDERPAIAFLLRRASTLDSILTDNEKEALLLENTLIKQFHPRYNIDLRDDKNYVSIRMGTDHSSPGIRLTRKILKDGATYFGPYASAASAREAVDQLIATLGIRSCSDTVFANRVRPCLLYDIGRCTAPCVGKISASAYAERVEEATLFLKGKRQEFIHRLKEKMSMASEKQEYETAAKYRDAVKRLQGSLETQKMVIHGGGDADVIGFVRTQEDAALCLLSIRAGTLLDRQTFHFRSVAGDDEEVLASFVVERYRASSIPSFVCLPFTMRAGPAVAHILSDRKGRTVRLCVPRRGLQFQMLKLAQKNAEAMLGNSSLLLQLGKRCSVGGAARVIECIDVSNLSGREAVGALVSFVDGNPEKSRYRLYNIRTLATPNDYAMMQEIVMRRFGGSASGRHLPLSSPDLLLVDGGKGQLAIVERALEEVGMDTLPVIAIAKSKGKEKLDRVYIPGRKNPLSLRANSPELLLLMRIRDEAHRFGINAHRRQRNKRALQ